MKNQVGLRGHLQTPSFNQFGQLAHQWNVAQDAV
jgi:hypothetical protein